MLLPVLTRVGMRPAARSVAIPGAPGLVGPDGFRAPEGLAAEVAGMLDDVAGLVERATGRAAEEVVPV
ncbi:hypothetical protein OG625_24940 [Streptomyces sp. NBC_01351]|uniref:hypothetical protein n=1 Tax=Streptomyces sp. NBC_01351 TaxID=2903833 RepID=UPI002E306EDD|nr:hypothetical protein [Streptomyces sp. NBC_01351]